MHTYVHGHCWVLFFFLFWFCLFVLDYVIQNGKFHSIYLLEVFILEEF